MHLSSTLRVGQEKKTVHAYSEKGLASRAKEMELKARQDYRDDKIDAIGACLLLLPINIWVFGLYGILVFAIAMFCGEFLTLRMSKQRGVFASLWYSRQWRSKWHDEYCRLSAPDSQSS